MVYAVIFSNPNRICGPYDSMDEIEALECFPLPSELVDPDAWEITGSTVTKFICEGGPEETGQIVRRRS